MSPKILVLYHSKTGNTEKLAKAVEEGARQISGINVEIMKTENASLKEILGADGYAIGSPSHFSIMSGQILTLITDLYAHREKLSGKPMAVFTTGAGDQVTALENIEKIIGVFNPKFVKPGIAVQGAPKEVDKAQAMALGKKLANAVSKK